MSEFVIKPATRQGMKALVGFYGKSGSGKTMSALLFARGLVGPKGRIGMIDSENGRGAIFADLIPGGYSLLDLDAPFSPDRYTEAIVEMEKHVDVIVVDSLSHEWSGEAGVLDMQEKELDRMAGDNWGKREACKMASWIKPKMSHKMMVNRLLRCKLPLICCLRGEEKTHITKGDDGKTKVITDQFSSPLFDPRFIFEMLVNFETVNRDGKGGFVHVIKCTHPSIAPLLPGRDEQIGVKHGEALAKFCQGSGSEKAAPAASPTSKPSTPPAASAATEKTRAWALDQLKLYPAELLQQYFEQVGWILPQVETPADIPLSHVPTSKAAVTALMGKIEAFRETGSV